MNDKNNRPMKTGDVVEITGAYFKNDNGLYFVEHTPGDPNWSGRDHCLRRIKRNGELSTAKDNLCFWPISAFVNSRDKRAAANQWNREHAEIEIKTFPHTEHIAKFFEAEAASLDTTIKRYTWDFGEDNQTVKDAKETQAFYRSVSDGLRAEQTAADLEAENASRRDEQEAEQAEREAVLRRRVAGRCFITETKQAHPINPGAPFVEIPFSENPAFYACTDQAGKTGEPLRLSVAAAEIIIRHYDAEVYADPDSAYDKTDFVIHYTDEHGQPSTYSGRYDLGGDAGGLVSHIRSFGENLRSMGHLWNSQPTEQDEADAAAILAVADLLTAEIAPTAPTPPTGGKVVAVEFTQPPPRRTGLLDRRGRQAVRLRRVPRLPPEQPYGADRRAGTQRRRFQVQPGADHSPHPQEHPASHAPLRDGGSGENQDGPRGMGCQAPPQGRNLLPLLRFRPRSPQSQPKLSDRLPSAFPRRRGVRL